MQTVTKHHAMASSGGVRLHYAEYLPKSTARGVVCLVHGLASSGRQFDLEAIRFAEAGYRVLVPDLRGHGLSGIPDGPFRSDDFSIAVMARDLSEMLDHADAGQVHWVGNSLGGILALWLLGTPFKTRLASLAVFGTCFSMNLPRHVGILLRAAFLPGIAVTARLAALTTTKSAVGRQAITSAIEQFNVRAGAAIAQNVSQYDFIGHARNFESPLLVLWGGLDRAVNLRLRGDLERLADRPNIRRIDLPAGGHCANFDMHDAFCAGLMRHWALAEEASAFP